MINYTKPLLVSNFGIYPGFRRRTGETRDRLRISGNSFRAGQQGQVMISDMISVNFFLKAFTTRNTDKSTAFTYHYIFSREIRNTLSRGIRTTEAVEALKKPPGTSEYNTRNKL